jgi:hypothetical protein
MLKEEVRKHVRLGCNVSNNRADSSGAWIWWNRGGIGRNRKDLILRIPGDVRDLFCFWLAWQRSSVILGKGRPRFTAAIRFTYSGRLQLHR